MKSTTYNLPVLKYNEQLDADEDCSLRMCSYLFFFIMVLPFSKVAVDSSQLWPFKYPNSKKNKIAFHRQQITSKEEEIERGNSKFGHPRHLWNVICYQNFITFYVTFGLGMTVRTHLVHRFISCDCWNIERVISCTMQNTVS